MVMCDSVTVYAFRYFDSSFERPVVAGFKATRAAIEQRWRGELIEGTAQQVDPEDLDAAGRYRRVATGWGELESR